MAGLSLYHMKYRCRMCGRTYSKGGTGTREVAIRAAQNVVFEENGLTVTRPLENQPGIVEIHECTDGSIGIADFIGMEYEEEK